VYITEGAVRQNPSCEGEGEGRSAGEGTSPAFLALKVSFKYLQKRATFA
jgi:hypothetical protein